MRRCVTDLVPMVVVLTMEGAAEPVPERGALDLVVVVVVVVVRAPCLATSHATPHLMSVIVRQVCVGPLVGF